MNYLGYVNVVHFSCACIPLALEYVNVFHPFCPHIPLTVEYANLFHPPRFAFHLWVEKASQSTYQLISLATSFTIFITVALTLTGLLIEGFSLFLLLYLYYFQLKSL